PTEKTLSYIENNFLSSYDRLDISTSVGTLTPWTEPRTESLEVPASEKDDGTASVIVNWLFGDSLDGEEGLTGDILSTYLFDGESAPLRRALLDCGLGEDLDDMCGYDNDLYVSVFTAGLKKTDPTDAEKIEHIITSTLQDLAENGPDEDLLEGALRRVEFSLREINEGGGFPFALNLASRIHRSWIYGGDPLSHIAYERPLSRIKEKIRGGHWFASAVRKYFLENTHRVTLVAKANSALGEKLASRTEEQARRLSADFTEEDRKRCLEETKQLVAEQLREHTPQELSVLPSLDKTDIPPKNETVPCRQESCAGIPLYRLPLFTAGITYLDIGFDLTGLRDDLIPYVPLYANYISRTGAAGLSSREMAKRVSLVTGGLSSYDIIAEDATEDTAVRFYGLFSGKALAEKGEEMIGILSDLFHRADFEDHELIKNLVYQRVNHLAHSIVSSGHSFGVKMGLSSLSGAKAAEERMSGPSQYYFLRELTSTTGSFDSKTVLTALKEIHRRMITRRNMFAVLTGADEDTPKGLEALLASVPAQAETDTLSFIPNEQKRLQALKVSSSVNYITQSWKLHEFTPRTVGIHHILARLLSTGYLWDKVRVEGGAYGGLSLFSSSFRAISFASFRDPNSTQTLQRYRDALDYLTDNITQADVDKTKFAVISKFDAPRGPHSRGFGEVISRICGSSPARRQEYRDAVLAAKAEDIRDAAADLKERFSESRIAAIVNESALEELIEAGYEPDTREL
ncbi:MAG: insulinase family protein, partial [Fibrobacterota bacterium]